MKRLLFILSVYLLAALPAAAQDKQAHFEKIEAAKVAFITKELNLTPKEAQQFFPVYNQYRKEIHTVFQRKRKEQRDNGERPRPRRGELEYDAEVLRIKKQYQKDFSQVVGNDRASRFFEAEREFREQLFNELKERRAREKR